MKQTSLCYIERGGRWLMLHRVSRKNDENAGKWVGIGGKFLDGESPHDCARREIREETGLCPGELCYRGLVTFVSDRWPAEQMHLFTAVSGSGDVSPCDEGVLEWIPIDDVPALPIWAGDRIFLRLLRSGRPFFSLRLCYCGEELVSAQLDGADLPL